MSDWEKLELESTNCKLALKVKEQADEITRLHAERNDYRKLYEAEQRAYHKLRAKLDGPCDHECVVIHGKNKEQAQRIAALEGALRDIADSELSSGGQLRMAARKALAKEQDND